MCYCVNMCIYLYIFMCTMYNIYLYIYIVSSSNNQPAGLGVFQLKDDENHQRFVFASQDVSWDDQLGIVAVSENRDLPIKKTKNVSFHGGTHEVGVGPV